MVLTADVPKMNRVTQAFINLIGLAGGWSEMSKSVFYSEYAFTKDLTGLDGLSLLEKSKKEIGEMITLLDDRGKMKKRNLPLKSITSATGAIADEIHFFPNLTQGAFGGITFEFLNDQLVTIRSGTNITTSNKAPASAPLVVTHPDSRQQLAPVSLRKRFQKPCTAKYFSVLGA